MPRPVETTAPPIIQPLAKPQWKYVSPAHLATSGIYSPEDLDRLPDHIMFPVEKPALMNSIAQAAMGRLVPQGSIPLYNLMDEDTLEKIATSTISRNGFITFGSASAGALAILLLFRLLKLIIDSIIRGYALHSVYGWSVHLVGAIWSSLTHLLLQLGKKGKDDNANTGSEATELLPMPTPNVVPKTPVSEGASPECPLNKDYGELNKYLQPIPSKQKNNEHSAR